MRFYPSKIVAYQGDVMTLPAFDLEESLIENLAGFTVKIENSVFYIYNKMRLPNRILLPSTPSTASQYLSTGFSPIQKFRWVHVPSTAN